MDLQTDGLICQNSEGGNKMYFIYSGIRFQKLQKKRPSLSCTIQLQKKMLKIIVRVIICTRNLKQELLASPPHRGKTSECVLAHN